MQAALSVKGWERLPREDIVTRACQAVAAVAHEKSRNAELVYRLQQRHEEGLEARQLTGRYEELQVGHLAVFVCPSVRRLSVRRLSVRLMVSLHLIQPCVFCLPVCLSTHANVCLQCLLSSFCLHSCALACQHKLSGVHDILIP